MPHCIIEYAETLGSHILPIQLIKAVHKGALNSGLFEEQDIKTRAIAFADYQVGTSDLRFIHVTAKILSGRDFEQKRGLSESILLSLEGLGLDEVSLTVEVADIDRMVYSKMVVA